MHRMILVLFREEDNNCLFIVVFFRFEFNCYYVKWDFQIQKRTCLFLSVQLLRKDNCYLEKNVFRSYKYVKEQKFV